MNLIEKLKQFNVEVTPEMEKAFEGDFLSAFEVEKKLSKAQTERDSWKQKAEAAEKTLKGFEGIDPEKIQSELEDWKRKAEEAEKKAQKQLQERDYADAVDEALTAFKFTSEAAKRDVRSQIMAADLKLHDKKLLGLSDLVAQIKEADASAFVDEGQEELEQNKAQFTQQMGGTKSNPGGQTKDLGKLSMVEYIAERKK